MPAVMPASFENFRDIIRPIGFRPVWISPEGIITACERFGTAQRWEVPSSIRVMQGWMRERGYELKISGAGRVAREVMRRLGRFGVSVLKNREILQLLNRTATGEMEVELEPGEAPARRKATAPALAHQTLERVLRRISPNPRAADRELEYLLDRGVLRIGLRLECRHCGHGNWYPLAGLREELDCERCLQPFRFPSANPPQRDWYYRAVGPFATDNYAQGSYTVALAYRALTFDSSAEATWVPSFTLSGSGSELEADFAMWWGRSMFLPADPLLVFGECKSFFNRFEAIDVRRMDQLGRAFPGSVLVFCTLRDDLDPREKLAIGRLALAGRKSLGPGTTRNPVIVLTGLELFGNSIPRCWSPEMFSEKAHWLLDRADSLPKIADLTQQLHLGLESYHEWVMKSR